MEVNISFMEKNIRVRTGKITYYGNGMIKFILKDGTEIEKDDIHEIHRTIDELTGGKKHSILTDARCEAKASKEARDYASSRSGERNTVAEAILVRSTSMKLLANFYIKFHKPKVPTKMFDSEDKAVAWLDKFAPALRAS